MKVRKYFMKKRKNNKRKRNNNFQLNWNINNIFDFQEAIDIFDNWTINNKLAKKDVRVRDVIENANPNLYKRLSRGDKCRVGRAISYRFKNNSYIGIIRGTPKGVTNTYYKN